MKALVERLRHEALARNIATLETLMVNIWSADGQIEFRCGFSLRSDSVSRSLTIKVPAGAAETDIEREGVVRAVFDELQEQIDGIVSQTLGSGNRLPSINPARDREIAWLMDLLAKLEAIPPDRREKKAADARAETVRAMLRDLGEK